MTIEHDDEFISAAEVSGARPVVVDGRTRGLSPKAVLAFLFPLIAAVLSAGASFVVTGNFSDAEIRTAASGVILSGIAAVGAYVGRTGAVRQ